MKKKIEQVRLGGRVSPEVAAIVIDKIRRLGFTYGDVANIGAFWEAIASGRVSVNLVVTREELKKLSEKS
jgi:chromosome condensin MukBEF complex kleisin-like MukF subunit